MDLISIFLRKTGRKTVREGEGHRIKWGCIQGKSRKGEKRQKKIESYKKRIAERAS